MFEIYFGKKWPRQPISMMTNETPKLSSRLETKGPYQASFLELAA